MVNLAIRGDQEKRKLLPFYFKKTKSQEIWKMTMEKRLKKKIIFSQNSFLNKPLNREKINKINKEGESEYKKWIWINIRKKSHKVPKFQDLIMVTGGISSKGVR